jgi:Domain of unknown function (DUF5666)
MSFAIRSLVATLALLVLPSVADAQSVRLRGVIESVNGDTLTVRTREGETAIVRLKQGAPIGAVVKAELIDIKPGLFIGAAALPGPEGALKALEVHIFPESMRGMGEGFHPFDLAPGSSMTNGGVSGLVETIDGLKLTVAYKGGEQTILVDKQTPIVAMTAGAAEDLKSGVGIIVFGTGRSADGGYEATRLVVGRDGVKPPM